MVAVVCIEFLFEHFFQHLHERSFLSPSFLLVCSSLFRMYVFDQFSFAIMFNKVWPIKIKKKRREKELCARAHSKKNSAPQKWGRSWWWWCERKDDFNVVDAVYLLSFLSVTIQLALISYSSFFFCCMYIVCFRMFVVRFFCERQNSFAKSITSQRVCEFVFEGFVLCFSSI